MMLSYIMTTAYICCWYFSECTLYVQEIRDLFVVCVTKFTFGAVIAYQVLYHLMTDYAEIVHNGSRFVSARLQGYAFSLVARGIADFVNRPFTIIRQGNISRKKSLLRESRLVLIYLEQHISMWFHKKRNIWNKKKYIIYFIHK